MAIESYLYFRELDAKEWNDKRIKALREERQRNQIRGIASKKHKVKVIQDDDEYEEDEDDE